MKHVMDFLFKDKEEFKKLYKEKFVETEGKAFEQGSTREHYHALVSLLKDRLNLNWTKSIKSYSEKNERQVYYFSMEFLIGKLLEHYLVNLGLVDVIRDGLNDFGVSLEDIYLEESDAGLGNGGLGRLAACFLDSLAFLGIPGHGNGMRYQIGLFAQKFVDGYQVEMPDNWLKNPYPWEQRKAEKAVVVKFKGRVEHEVVGGVEKFVLRDYEPVLAVPYDVPMVSYNSIGNINNLRLWKAEPMSEELDMAMFNAGDFARAMGYRSEVEAISYILYPEDSGASGRELRLKQEYLIVAAGIGSIIRHHKKNGNDIKILAKKVAIHINDTHPALAVPELMRVLIDEEGMGWEQAWAITGNTISYTNHTILPEALEKWPVDLMRYLLPRLYQITEEIDRRYKEVILRRFPGNHRLVDATCIIKDGYVRMANLSVIGSYSVNGVAALHTDILKSFVMADHYKVAPYKFNNKTNGISHRRFLLTANYNLSKLITKTIGYTWKFNAFELEKLMDKVNDDGFLIEMAEAKFKNKQKLAAYIKKHNNVVIDPNSIFDVQVKRIHAYKRQLMNALKIMDLYNRLKEDPKLDITPVTFIFAGKAAPGYHYAKMVIKLINSIADIVNNDKAIKGKIKVVFLENFNVTLGQLIYTAADISEQISTASQEASGTGNMKFMMNGAITLGTMDGANVEIYESVGEENIKIFGLSADKVIEYQRAGGYRSWDEYMGNASIKKVLDQLVNGYFKGLEGEFREIFDSLTIDNDSFFVLKDFIAYRDAFTELCGQYKDKKKWSQMALNNIAKSGVFSADRTIKDYAADIWKVRFIDNESTYND